MPKVLGVMIASLVLVAPAEAAVRYAGPTGAGTTCSNGAPCSFETAVEGAADFDEIIVKPGTHTVNAQVFANSKTGLEIHGPEGQPWPVVTIAAPAGGASMLVGTLAHLHDLDLTCTASTSSCVFAGPVLTIEDATIANIGGGFSTAVYIGSSAGSGTTVLRNVFARGPGTAATISAANAQVVHTTLSSPGTALSLLGGATRTVRVRDTIAEGTGQDIAANGSDLTLNIDYSQYGVINASGGAVVQEGAHKVGLTPIFMSATDLHVQAGSGGIGMGISDFLAPSTDIDGDPRPLGVAPDIGADEFRTPATTVTEPPTGVGLDVATLHGTLNPQNEDVTWHFEYGPTIGAYGSSTADQAASPGTADQAVSAAVSSLAPATTYYARLVTADGYGTVVYGEDVMFTTNAPPVVEDPPPPGSSDPGTPPPSGSADPGTPPASSQDPQSTPPATTKPTSSCTVPKLKGLSIKRARARLKKAGCRAGRVRGRGRVARQSRKAGVVLPAGTTVGLRLKRRARAVELRLI